MSPNIARRAEIIRYWCIGRPLSRSPDCAEGFNAVKAPRIRQAACRRSPLPAPPGLRAGARFALAPGLPRNDVGHEKGTCGDVVDSRAYRRPTRITRRHLFRVGQRAARSVPERRSAKFRRASRFLLVQGRQRAQESDCAIAFVGLPVSQGGRSLSGGAF